MPLDDKQLKRVSNLLTQMQVRDALNTPRESLDASPKRMDTYNLQRLIDVNTRDKGISKYHAEQLEKQGEQTNPVTKQRNKYSEQWLQSTGQSIPGLDSEGTSAMNALDLMGLPGAVKLAGTIGREGIKRGIGRVATNIIDTEAENISSSLRNIKFKDAIKAIIKDEPLYMPKMDEAPYRMMFGLKPRKFTGNKFLTMQKEYNFDDYYANNPDGSLRFKPNTESYDHIKLDIKQGGASKEYVMGHYNLNPKTGKYWDKWDVGLNPGELKTNLNLIRNIKTPEDAFRMYGKSQQNYKSIPTFRPVKVINASGEIDKTKLALEKTKAILRLLERAAVRKTVDFFSDPVVIQGTIKGIKSR